LATFYLGEFLIGKSAIKTAAFFHKITVWSWLNIKYADNII
jgi:hypothetical protein